MWSCCCSPRTPKRRSVIPALSLLGHSVRSAAPKVAALADVGPYDVVLVDARSNVAGSRSLCRLLGCTGLDVPVVVVIGEGGLIAIASRSPLPNRRYAWLRGP